MEETRSVNSQHLRRTLRIFFKTLLVLFLFVIMIFFLLLTPPAQKFMTGKVENYLQEKLKTRVEIGSISFGLSGNIDLEDIYVEDLQGDTLFSGGSLKANLALLKLFSNEVQVKDLEMKNMYANIKRTLPDTVYNFQFLIDAFISEQPKDADTAQTAPLKLNISDLALENIRLRYEDVITGSDVFAKIGNLSATIDKLDPANFDFGISSIIGRNVTASIKQYKPLLEPEPVSKDLAEEAVPSAMKLNLGTIDLTKFNLQFDNDVSAISTSFNIGRLKAEGRNFDLANNSIHLRHIELNNTKSNIRLGKGQGAQVAINEIEKEVDIEKSKGWTFRVDQLRVNDNSIKFDNDNTPANAYGIDFAHLDAKELNLHADDIVFATDSIGANILEGSFREKSGFVLNELKGELLYAYNQSYIKNLYLKTPGSEIKRTAVLEYASFDQLLNDFPATVLNVEIENSRVQVKDILAFAPQLRNNAAFRNPNEVWDLHLIGSGTLNNLYLESLKFNGLENTIVNASGRLSGLMNPENAGGNFVIHRLHTTQSDIALFTGQRLSNDQINLPETFDISGTVRGNAGQLNTSLNVNSSAGYIAVNGSFSNLMYPERMRYNARLNTAGFALGRVLRQEATIGAVSGNFSFNGTGLTPNSINTNLSGDINRISYNNYNYRNIDIKGKLNGSNFSADLDIDDPNADASLTASGSFGDNTSFVVQGMIDSLKTLPLNLTTEAMIFRGKIDGTVANLNSDYLDADILVTNALIVSKEERLVLDTISLVSGRTDTANFIRLRSDIANADVTGEYKFSQLGSIIQSSIEPYFSVTPSSTTPALDPYNFRFTADLTYNPIFSAFIPGLTAMDPLHAEGSFISGQGMNANVITNHISMQGTEISDLNFAVRTTSNGLEIRGMTGHLKSGSFDVYNARINATALNNVIDFNLGIDDKTGTNQYYFNGLLQQPSRGTYAISLRPDSLLLNYELWSIPANNQIIIGPNSISATNFVLSNNNQQLSIQSLAGNGQQPLQVNFNNFQLGTITGFVQSDTLFANGLINGNITFRNIMQEMAFTSDLAISDLSLNQDTLGNLDLQVSTSDGNRFNTDVRLTGRGNDVTIDGYFTPVEGALDLNLDLDIDSLALASIEGASNQAISNASGFIDGQVRIRGSSSAPEIRGNLDFNDASFATSFLGSQFYIDDETIAVTEKGFRLDNFTIRDSAQNRLNLDGDIFTSNFTNYQFALAITAQDFMVLNSEKQKGQLYYGRLNISTDLRVSGTEIKPVVDGNITINDGTNLTIVVPQEEPGIEQRKGVVEFVNMAMPEADTLFTGIDSMNVSSILGMDIAANIEVKKEAILNVVIDEANGDFLNVQGEALLTAGIDPSGKMTLTGNYTLENGSYEISFDLLRRKFEIEQGSTITWIGEPTTAQLDVKAIYVANTPPIDLVQDQIAASTPAIRNTYLQRLPFEVHLNLTGELLKPVIDFDIILPEDKNYGVSNDIVTLVQSRLSQLRQDEGSINKQVFSLLLLGRFVGENPLESSGGGFEIGTYARQSVSKLLTEQLNQLAAGLVGGVEIDFDVASTEDYTTGSRRNRTDLNVGLSKRLLNDRLKISVGSNFQLEGPQNSNQGNNNLAGNVAIDYQLSKDGRYLLRYFRRNQYEGVVDGYIIENGLSFILSVDYNRFREILKRKKQRVTERGTTETTETSTNNK